MFVAIPLDNGIIDRQCENALIAWSHCYAARVKTRDYLRHLEADRRYAFRARQIKVWH